MALTLSTLLHDVNYKIICGDIARKISSVEYDSRKIVADSLFVAIKGFTSDGHDFIGKAIDSGACAIVVDAGRENYPDDQLIGMSRDGDITVVSVDDSRKAVALLSAAFYHHPEDRLDLVGVTGTKGKTTTTFMINEILKCNGHRTGLIGTVCNLIGDEKRHAAHTTPEAHEIYELLEEMSQDKFDSCVMEVSSQGLKLDRVYGLRFDVGCFTNLYEDHIAENEHPDMDDYFNCKLKIFDSSRLAVVNRDCNVADKVIEYAGKRCPVYTYGLAPDADCYAENITMDRRGSVNGTLFDVVSPWYNGKVYVDLSGTFNVYNALCAITVAGLLKVDFSAVKRALAEVFVPGRLQPVKNDLGINILVDYAHNGAGLENVLNTMKEYTEGKVISVFGCGGNRANTRRFEMGEISGRLADYTVITSDNPRKEDPLKIIDDILVGMHKTDGKYEIEPDRETAIGKAIRMADRGDTVIIAGKGHEDYQIFADRTIHFDDVEVASAVVKKLEAEA